MKIKNITIEYDDGSVQELVEKTEPTPEPEPAYKFTKNEVTETTETTATINFVTEVPTQAHIEYWKVGSSEDVKRGAREESFNFSDHTQVLRELDSGVTYGYQVITNDEAGSEVKSKVVFFDTVAAPEPTDLYFLLNWPSWKESQWEARDHDLVSESTYFVLTVNADGSLNERTGDIARQQRLISEARSFGKKVTFSIAGGSQNVEAITSAVTERNGLVNAIDAHMRKYGYDGVTLDIENTNIQPLVMHDFIAALRAKLGAEAIIGAYTQPYQLNTVWRELPEIAQYIDWISPMIYDYAPYTKEALRNTVNEWADKAGKAKVLAGVAVNYPTNQGGLSPEQYAEVLQMAKEEGWKGVGIWEQTLFTEAWEEVHTNNK